MQIEKHTGIEIVMRKSRKPLKAHENVLVICMPKMGKTRSVYQALKAALPDFYVIRVPPRKVEAFRLPFLKKNYLVFFDDLNEFVGVNFDDMFKSASLISERWGNGIRGSGFA